MLSSFDSPPPPPSQARREEAFRQRREREKGQEEERAKRRQEAQKRAAQATAEKQRRAKESEEFVFAKRRAEVSEEEAERHKIKYKELRKKVRRDNFGVCTSFLFIEAVAMGGDCCCVVSGLVCERNDCGGGMLLHLCLFCECTAPPSPLCLHYTFRTLLSSLSFSRMLLPFAFLYTSLPIRTYTTHQNFAGGSGGEATLCARGGGRRKREAEEG